jgi:hypothetical protein
LVNFDAVDLRWVLVDWSFWYVRLSVRATIDGMNIRLIPIDVITANRAIRATSGIGINQNIIVFYDIIEFLSFSIDF